MKLQRGFSVLELMMVMAVSAIIMTILLQIYNQVSRNVLRIDRLVFEDTQILTLKNRFEKDLAGLSAIWFTQADLEAQEKTVDLQQKNVPTQEKKKTSQYFYSVNKDGHLHILTFATTAALQSYASVQSRFIRVVYQVEADPKYKNMYRLMRKEINTPTENIDDASLKPGKFYELVGGIKSIEMTYQLIDKVEIKRRADAEQEVEKSSGKASSQEKNKPIIRVVKQWTSDGKKASEKNDTIKKDAIDEDDLTENEDLGGSVVPKFVVMKIVFGATDRQLEKEYKLEFYIPSFIDNLVKLPAVQVPVKPNDTNKQPQGAGNP